MTKCGFLACFLSALFCFAVHSQEGLFPFVVPGDDTSMV